MPSCEEIIQKLFEENPNMVDKEIIAKMKELKDEKGKRLYKTSTIASRLRQFRVGQRTSSELPKIEKIDEDISIDASKSDTPELKNVNLEGAKKEVEEAFGRRDEMNNEGKNVEPQELDSGHKKYDGRIDPIRAEIDKHINGNGRIPLKTTSDSTSKDIISEKLDKIIKGMDVMNEEILQLKQGGSAVVVDELVDVQLRESIISKLDALKADDSHDLNETIGQLIELNNEMKDVTPSFLKKISLDKTGSVHGKLFMHEGNWRFVKRAKPIIYGIIGAVTGSISLFALFVLLTMLELI